MRANENRCKHREVYVIENISSPGSIDGALQRYGLSLKSRMVSVEILIVDSIDKAPTEN